MKYYVATYLDDKQRIDKVVSTNFKELSRSRVKELIESGNILVNSKNVKCSYSLKEGDNISLDIPEDVPLNVEKEDIPLDIVYEDSDIIIINKPQGMVVHPSFGHNNHTLVNAILNHCDDLSGINGVTRPGIVHRIDKDTSGLICVAKNDEAHNKLAAQLKDHTMARTYIALVRGVIKENTGTINLPIGRDSNNRKKMAVTKTNSKPAITNFEVLQRFKDHTLIKCHLFTGRTHQIRVHLSYIGHPVEGDSLYIKRGANKIYGNGQLLTAVELTLIHPKTGEKMTFNIDLPDYFKEVLNNLD